MMGFRSPPFLLFLFPLPLAALFAAAATCLALVTAAFLMSLPFIISWWEGNSAAIERLQWGFGIGLTAVAHELVDSCVKHDPSALTQARIFELRELAMIKSRVY